MLIIQFHQNFNLLVFLKKVNMNCRCFLTAVRTTYDKKKFLTQIKMFQL